MASSYCVSLFLEAPRVWFEHRLQILSEPALKPAETTLCSRGSPKRRVSVQPAAPARNGQAFWPSGGKILAVPQGTWVCLGARRGPPLAPRLLLPEECSQTGSRVETGAAPVPEVLSCVLGDNTWVPSVASIALADILGLPGFLHPTLLTNPDSKL